MKDMKEDYLWDRSGEPDAELQKLEEILGTLKYQPRPLQIPDDLQIGGQRRYFQALAIAAAIALFAVALGLWIFFNRTPSTPQFAVRQEPPVEQKPVEQKPVEPKQQESVTPDKRAPEKLASYRPEHRRRPAHPGNRNLVAGNRAPSNRKETSQPELTPEEMAEKQQLLTALRLVSAKLNVAQRRTQGVPQTNTIRNQRKIG